MAWNVTLENPTSVEDFPHAIDGLVQAIEDESDRNQAITLADAAKKQVQDGNFGGLVIGSLDSENGIALKPATQ